MAQNVESITDDDREDPAEAKLLPQCPRCDYSLRGMPVHHACPECGLQVDRRWYVFGERPGEWRITRWATVGVAVFLGMLVLYGWLRVIWLIRPSNAAALGLFVSAWPFLLLLYRVITAHAGFVAVGPEGVAIGRGYNPPVRYAWCDLRGVTSRAGGTMSAFVTEAGTTWIPYYSLSLTDAGISWAARHVARALWRMRRNAARSEPCEADLLASCPHCGEFLIERKWMVSCPRCGLTIDRRWHVLGGRGMGRRHLLLVQLLPFAIACLLLWIGGQWAASTSRPVFWVVNLFIIVLAASLLIGRRLLREVAGAGSFIAIDPTELVIGHDRDRIERCDLSLVGAIRLDRPRQPRALLLEIRGQEQCVPILPFFGTRTLEARVCIHLIKALQRMGVSADASGQAG